MTFAARGMDSVAQDLKYAVRSLRKAPGFTIVAALALALGIGANTVLFSVISFALLRPVPFSDPDRLLIINQTGCSSSTRPRPRSRTLPARGSTTSIGKRRWEGCSRTSPPNAATAST